jgi:hypothetical protein
VGTRAHRGLGFGFPASDFRSRFGFRPRIEPQRRSFKEGEIMRCNRCGGMISYEEFYGHCEYFFGWRCIVCGEIIDQVIPENRLKRLFERR